MVSHLFTHSVTYLVISFFSVQFYFILFYFILFCFILFHFILFYFILFYFFIYLFYFILFLSLVTQKLDVPVGVSTSIGCIFIDYILSGTVFALSDHILISCYHCVNSSMSMSNVSFLMNSTLVTDGQIIYEDEQSDIVIFKTSHNLKSCIEVFDGELNICNEVVVIGYPSIYNNSESSQKIISDYMDFPGK